MINNSTSCDKIMYSTLVCFHMDVLIQYWCESLCKNFGFVNNKCQSNCLCFGALFGAHLILNTNVTLPSYENGLILVMSFKNAHV